ncbi:MAG: GH92 family glycosyl hydrolase [Bacteroidota bacterium]
MNNLKNITGILMIGVVMMLLQGCNNESKQPVDYADPMIGTSNSRWMLYPGASMPFGMVKLSPDNQEEMWKAGYEYTIEQITGFSHLHSWTMGGLLTMPIRGGLRTQPGSLEGEPESGYNSRFRHEDEFASPGYYKVDLYDYDITAELTATTRTGIQRYTFPQAEEAYILFDLKFPTEYGFEIKDAEVRKVDENQIEGYVKQQSTDWNEYTVHFVAQLSKPFQSFDGWVGGSVKRDVQRISGSEDMGAALRYSPSADEQIVMKTGLSFVSIEQARLNLEEETGDFGWDFNSARTHAEQVWNDLLSRIEIEGGSEEDKVKFYTNLYRSYSARTIMSDVNGKYVDMCEEEVQLEDPGSPVYGCDAFWNTFWNLNQLWTLSTPDIANKWVKSLLEIYDRGGWLPKGPAGIEYSSIMVASHEIPLMVSAYQKGIRDYDVNKAYEAMKHNQTEPGKSHSCGGHVGNRQLASYKDLGYVPAEKGPVSNTMEYAYDDWCVAQMAKALDKEEDYKEFIKRAGYYKNVFDPDVKYVRQKHKDGTWAGDFDPFSHSGFVEGNSWQYTFFVPHDVQGLINLIGRGEFNDRLDEGFERASRGNFMAMYGRGRGVNHGNQPNMQAAYLFNYSGKPWLTQKWARSIMEQYYRATPYDGWLGDEDQGQMGAWFVMSSMGLFEMRGGAAVKPVYEIGSPLFDKITIHLDSDYYSGETFVIETRNNSKENIYVQSATLNGESLAKPWFYHSELAKGGKLVLEMGPEPNKQWGSDPRDAPPSMSNN